MGVGERRSVEASGREVEQTKLVHMARQPPPRSLRRSVQTRLAVCETKSKQDAEISNIILFVPGCAEHLLASSLAKLR